MAHRFAELLHLCPAILFGQLIAVPPDIHQVQILSFVHGEKLLPQFQHPASEVAGRVPLSKILRDGKVLCAAHGTCIADVFTLSTLGVAYHYVSWLLFSFNCVFLFRNDLFHAFRCTGIGKIPHLAAILSGKVDNDVVTAS